jgi:hypothetical protein
MTTVTPSTISWPGPNWLEIEYEVNIAGTHDEGINFRYINDVGSIDWYLWRCPVGSPPCPEMFPSLEETDKCVAWIDENTHIYDILLGDDKKEDDVPWTKIACNYDPPISVGSTVYLRCASKKVAGGDWSSINYLKYTKTASSGNVVKNIDIFEQNGPYAQLCGLCPGASVAEYYPQLRGNDIAQDKYRLAIEGLQKKKLTDDAYIDSRIRRMRPRF